MSHPLHDFSSVLNILANVTTVVDQQVFRLRFQRKTNHGGSPRGRSIRKRQHCRSV